MLTTASSLISKTSQEITQSAITDFDYATLVLTHEQIFERLSYEQVLTIFASHEFFALGYLANTKHHTVADGLALSILAEKNEKVALLLIENPQLRLLLQGLDLARIGQSSALVAMKILEDEELRAKLKSAHLAMLGENQPTTAQYIASYPHLFQIEANDLGKLCKSNAVLAKAYLSNRELLRKCEGSTLALMVEMHPNLIWELLADRELSDKLDSQAFIILGRSHSDIALHFLKSDEYCRRLGPFGIARMLKHHPALAMQALDNPSLCAEFNGACFEQLAQSDEQVAIRVFAEHKKSLSLDERVMIAKNYSSLALELLKDAETCPLISGKNLVILGMHSDVCEYILQTKVLREKALKFNIGLMGLRNIEHARRMLSEPDLRESLQQLDLANLCKNFMFATQLTLNSEHLQSKISSSYLELLQQRMKTVISLSSYVQEFVKLSSIQTESSYLSEPTPYSFPLFTVTSASATPSASLPVPEADSKFAKNYQSQFC